MENYLSQNLGWLMEYQKVSVRDLSRATDIAIITIHKLKSGDNINPTIETIRPIAQYFNLTIDQLVFDKISDLDKLNHKPSNLIPLVKWDEIKNFPDCTAVDYVNCDYQVSPDVYCFRVMDGSTLIFEDRSILIVDNSLTPMHGDNVIVLKTDSQMVSIKKIIIDDSWFLQSVTSGLQNSTLFNFTDYIVLGVVVGQIKYFRNT